MAKVFNQRPSVPNARPSKTLGGNTVPVDPVTPVGAQQPAASETNVSAATNGASLTEFVSLLRNIVEPFAIVDDATIEKNIKLAGGYGMSADDRTISFECAEYVISNLSYIVMGLVLDQAFKSTFLDALNVEMEIDTKDEATRAKIRESMKDKKPYNSLGSIVIGLTGFSPAVTAEFMTKMEEGFEALNKYADEFDDTVRKLDVKQKAEYGFIASNFMYLIRAFTHNDLFMSYVITVIERVKATLKSV